MSNVLDYEGLKYFYQQYIAGLRSDVEGLKKNFGSRVYGGTELGGDGTATDEDAQYSPIILSADEEGTIGFKKEFSDLPKGTYSVMVRAKISDNTSEEKVLKAEAGDASAFSVVYISPEMFSVSEKYQTLGFTVEHNTDLFTVQLSIGTALPGVTFSIDYLTIAPTFTALGGVG